MKGFKFSASVSLIIRLLLISLFLAEETTAARHGSLKRGKLNELERKLRERMIASSSSSSGSSISAAKPMPSPVALDDDKKNGISRVFCPIKYGADPTGAQDSSDAIMSALEDAVSVIESQSGGGGGLELLPGIKDLGGVVIDLQGGSYIINKPIRFPSAIGNVLVQGGSIRASNIFPGDRHLIELWAPNSRALATTAFVHNYYTAQKDQNTGIYYEDITFRDILFDSSYRGGGLFVIDSARIRISSCFFLHFTTQGILVERGHETFICSSFLGQHSTVGGDSGEKGFSGTAIDLASNDNAVTDVAIFSAATGIVLRGQANVITGVHCYNKATGFGGVGIHVKAAQTRIVSCYLDFNAVVIEDPSQVLVANGFFLGDGNVVLKSIRAQISGLTIVNNMFSGEPNNKVPIVQLDGEFTNIDQVVVDQNNVNGMSLKSTVGKLTVAGNGTKWVADLAALLVFPNRINHVQYSFYSPAGVSAGGFPAHAVTNVSSNVVVVESDRAVNAVVSVVVDQHSMVGEQNFLM